MIRPSESLRGTNLNSVWLEGTVVSDPIGCPGPSGKPMVRFQIRDHRPLDTGPPSVFEVEASYPALGGHRSQLGQGQQVRIIGRLKEERHEVRVVGELIETLGS